MTAALLPETPQPHSAPGDAGDDPANSLRPPASSPREATEEAALAHAEYVWHALSEALDARPEAEHTAFLTRLALLAALDHLHPAQLDALLADAAG